VQALLSVQLEPSVLAGSEQIPVLGLQVPTSWHWSDAVQTTGVPGTHAPAWHVSFWVHALLSLQEFVLLVCVQAPVSGLHPSVVQGLLSLQRVAASEQGPLPVSWTTQSDGSEFGCCDG
jgi:hypothetical protein